MSDFLDRAVQSHVQWKLKLLAAVSGGQKIDKSVACVDNQCELGKWIYSEGRQYGSLPAFQALQAQHNKFHQCVCAVADLIEAGRLQEAKADISHGAYKRASADTVDSILKLKALQVVAV